MTKFRHSLLIRFQKVKHFRNEKKKYLPSKIIKRVFLTLFRKIYVDIF